MDTSIFIDFSFDAAHWLPNVPEGHKCGRLHGHTYHLTLWFDGPIDAKNGWIVDYGVVKEAVDPILQLLDHHLLNHVRGLENPTCEVIAQWLAERVRGAVVLRREFGLARLSMVDLRETPRAGVRVYVQ